MNYGLIGGIVDKSTRNQYMNAENQRGLFHSTLIARFNFAIKLTSAPFELCGISGSAARHCSAVSNSRTASCAGGDSLYNSANKIFRAVSFIKSTPIYLRKPLMICTAASFAVKP